MWQLLKQLDAKTLNLAGAILLSFFVVYVLFQILTNDLTHINSSIEKQSAIQNESNAVLKGVVGVIESNTRILERIENRIK